MENWELLRAAALSFDNLRLTLDQAAKTVTVEILSLAPKDALVERYPILVIGTPSADGRYFGIDYQRMMVQTE